MSEKTIPIPGRLKNVAIGGHVTGSEDIDAGGGKTQKQVNDETNNTLALHQSEISGLNSQNYVSVSTYSSLPATGSVDTVYRVSSWDGNANSGAGAADVTKYTEYAWNGTAYIVVSVKTQIGEVFDISEYKAVGGTLAKFADLSAALDSGNNVPVGVRKGGMSVKFVQSSDNKYVQYRCTASGFTTTVTEWCYEGNDTLVDDSGFVEVITDSEDKLLEARKSDGTKIEYNDLEVKGKILNKELNSQIGTIQEKTNEIFEPVQKVISFIEPIEDSEWLKVDIDNEGKVLGGRKSNGTIKEYMPIELSEEATSSLKTRLDIPEYKLRLDSRIAQNLDYQTGNSLNTLVGDGARGANLGTGRGNCILGTGNMFFATTANRNVAIGHHSQYRQVTGEDNVSVGNEACDNINGNHNTAVGGNALRAQKYGTFPGEIEVTNPVQVAMEECVAVGHDSQMYSVGSKNTTVGADSMKGTLVEGVGCQGQENTAVGFSAKWGHRAGNHNTAIGAYAEAHNTEGSNNVAIGYCAGRHHASGDNMLFIDSLPRQTYENELSSSMIVGQFSSNVNEQWLKLNAMFACNGATPQQPLVAESDAEDLATAITLLNQIKSALIRCGIMKSE